MRPELPVLIKARALIDDPAKWGKGQRRHDRPSCTYCAAEAIEEIEKAGPLRRAAYNAVLRAAGAEDTRSLTPMVEWNDDPETTYADVIDAFDKAIASAS